MARRVTPWLAAALWALAASSGAVGADKAPAVPLLRGPERPTPVAPATPATPQSRTGLLFSPMPEIAPRYKDDPAPRIGGLTVEAGAGQCRQSCARDYYACSSTDDVQDCSRAWTRCLATCAGASAGGL